MLVEIKVTNFRSYSTPQTISLVKGSGKELSATNSFSVNAPNKIELLRSAAIYGANASGKSNLLQALQVMRGIVLQSAKEQQRGDLLPVDPFRLSAVQREQPSEFEVIFVADGVRYQYGFSASTEHIVDEWLFAFPKGHAQLWFERSWDAKQAIHVWRYGSHLQGEKALWSRSTRDNALFLSTAVQLNSEQLMPVFDWFKHTLQLVGVDGVGPGFTASMCDEGDKAKVLDFLQAADINIDDILVEAKPFDERALLEDMPQELRSVISKGMKGKKQLQIRTVRHDDEGKSVEFEYHEESDGTQRLFGFAGPWVDVLENGHVLFIDELHNSLHPRLVRFLVELFHNKKTNPKNAQLVFTSHDTSILNQEAFRRDQIWFCEKDLTQATEIYPLMDFSPRKGRENLELAYLSGRYGAVPFVGDVGMHE